MSPQSVRQALSIIAVLCGLLAGALSICLTADHEHGKAKIELRPVAPRAALPEYEQQPTPEQVGSKSGLVGKLSVPQAVGAASRTSPAVPERTKRIAQVRRVTKELRARLISHYNQGHKAPRLRKAYFRRKALLARLIRRARREARELAPMKAVRWAQSKLGVTESPPFSNRGPQIDQWQLAHGMIGQAWCGAYAGMALRAGGVYLPNGVVYTPTILAWARSGSYGLRIVKDPEPGDLVLYDFFAGGPPVMHVGLYERDGQTLEGNTSSDDRGSQDNGGGVFRRKRGPTYVVAYVRPSWPTR